MGLLSQRGAPAWHPAGKDLQNACARAAAYCQEQGYPIEKLAIQFSTSLNPRIATTLFSSANPDNVLKNIRFVEEDMDENLVGEVKAITLDLSDYELENTVDNPNAIQPQESNVTASGTSIALTVPAKNFVIIVAKK